MSAQHHVFLSYSRNDPASAAALRAQLEQQGQSLARTVAPLISTAG